MSQIHLKKDLRTSLFLITSYWAPFSSSGEGKSVEEPWDLQSPTWTNISNYLKDGFGCFSSEFQLLKQLKEWCIWMSRCDMCICFLPIFEILTVGYIGRWFQLIVNIAQLLEMVFQNKATGKVKTGFWKWLWHITSALTEVNPLHWQLGSISKWNFSSLFGNVRTGSGFIHFLRYRGISFQKIDQVNLGSLIPFFSSLCLLSHISPAGIFGISLAALSSPSPHRLIPCVADPFPSPSCG